MTGAGVSSARGRNVLVTGAAGFIGRQVVNRLIAEGATVHAVTRGTPDRDDGQLRWWRVDLSDQAATDALFVATQPEVVLHLAGWPVGSRTLAEIPTTFRSNLVSSVNVLSGAAAHGKPRVVLTGSLEEPPASQPDQVASSPYAVSKWAARGYGRLFRDLFELPVVNLRVFMVYGPGQRDVRKLVPYTILSLLRGTAPHLSSGQREVDWIFSEDVVDAYLAAAFAPGVSGAEVDIGSGQLVSIRQVVEMVAKLLGNEVEPQFGAIADRRSEQVRVADVAATERTLGWRARVRMDEGLKRTIAWYAAELAAGRVQ
jgi:UDP-glucose 4-epimerase